jgi:hypothetical protein
MVTLVTGILFTTADGNPSIGDLLQADRAVDAFKSGVIGQSVSASGRLVNRCAERFVRTLRAEFVTVY